MHAANRLANLERELTSYLDDLDAALLLLTRVWMLYGRLEDKERATLLQILARRIIVDVNGEIIGHELHPPFAYLTEMKTGLQRHPRGRGST